MAEASEDPSQFWLGVRHNLMNMMTHSFQSDFHRSLALADGNSVGCHLADDNTTRVCEGRDNLGGMNVLYGSSCPVSATGLTDCTCQITARNNQSCQSCSFCDNSGAFSLDCRNILVSEYSCAGVDCYDNCLGRGYGTFDPSAVINFTNTVNTTTSGSAAHHLMVLPVMLLAATMRMML
jgi:hypothetical protein